MRYEAAFLRTSLVTETLNSLEMVHHFLNLTDPKFYNLKWALISAHFTLQNILVLSLRGTTNWEVTDQKHSETRSYEDITYNIDSHLKKFMELFSLANSKYDLDKQIPVSEIPIKYFELDLPTSSESKSYSGQVTVHKNGNFCYNTGRVNFSEPIEMSADKLCGFFHKGNNSVICIEKLIDQTQENYTYSIRTRKIKGPFVLTLSTLMNRLNDDRNEFIHYMPKGWSIEVTRITELIFYAIKTIEYIKCHAHCLTRDFLEDDMKALNQLIRDIYLILKNKY